MIIEWFLVITAGLLGGAIGSFLNVVIWRLPEKMSLLTPPSHCPKCGHGIRFYDNLPVLGWLLLRGRCRDCREPISIRYPLVEMICTLLAVFWTWSILIGHFSAPEGALLSWKELSEWFARSTSLAPEYLVWQELAYDTLLKKGIGLSALFYGLFALLLTLGLIEYDRKPVPGILLFFEGGYTILGFAAVCFLVTERDFFSVESFRSFVYALFTLLVTGALLFYRLPRTHQLELVITLILLIPFLPLSGKESFFSTGNMIVTLGLGFGSFAIEQIHRRISSHPVPILALFFTLLPLSVYRLFF